MGGNRWRAVGAGIVVLLLLLGAILGACRPGTTGTLGSSGGPGASVSPRQSPVGGGGPASASPAPGRGLASLAQPSAAPQQSDGFALEPPCFTDASGYDIEAAVVLPAGDYMPTFDWGDGSTPTESGPWVVPHTYATAGTYTITVTVGVSTGTPPTGTVQVSVPGTLGEGCTTLTVGPPTGGSANFRVGSNLVVVPEGTSESVLLPVSASVALVAIPDPGSVFAFDQWTATPSDGVTNLPGYSFQWTSEVIDVLVDPYGDDPAVTLEPTFSPVTTPPPDALFMNVCVLGTQASFFGGANWDASGIVSMGWVWGDGTSASAPSWQEVHTYASSGTYPVTLFANYGPPYGQTQITDWVKVPGNGRGCAALQLTATSQGSISYTYSGEVGTVAPGSSVTLYLAVSDDVGITAEANPGNAFLDWSCNHNAAHRSGTSLAQLCSSPTTDHWNVELVEVALVNLTTIIPALTAVFSEQSSTFSIALSASANPAAVDSSVQFTGTVATGSTTGTVTWSFEVPALEMLQSGTAASVTFQFNYAGSYDVVATAVDGSGSTATADLVLTVSTPSDIDYVTVSASPAVVVGGATATVTATVGNDLWGGQVGAVVCLTSSAGTLTATQLTTDANGQVATTLTDVTGATATVEVTATTAMGATGCPTSGGVSGQGTVVFTPTTWSTWQTDPDFAVTSYNSTASVSVPFAEDSTDWTVTQVPLYLNVSILTPNGVSTTTFESEAASYFGFTPVSDTGSATVAVVAVGGLGPLATILDTDASAAQLTPEFVAATDPFLSDRDLVMYLNSQLPTSGPTSLGTFAQEILNDLGMANPTSITTDLTNEESAGSLEFGFLPPASASWGLADLVSALGTGFVSQVDHLLSCEIGVWQAAADPVGFVTPLSDGQTGLSCLFTVYDYLSTTDPLSHYINWQTFMIDPNGTTMLPRITSSGTTALGYDPTNGTMSWNNASEGFLFGGDGTWDALLPSTASPEELDFGLVGVGPATNSVPFVTTLASGPDSTPAIGTGVLAGSMAEALSDVSVNGTQLSWASALAMTVSSTTVNGEVTTVEGTVSECGHPVNGTVQARDGASVLGQADVLEGQFTLSFPSPSASYELNVVASAPGVIGTTYGEWQQVTPPQRSTVQFNEQNLPASLLSRRGWTVALDGVTESSTSWSISFSGVPDGIVPVLVTGPPHYATTESGNLTVSADTAVEVSFSPTPTSTLSFTQAGLKGVKWCVALDSEQVCSSKASLKFTDLPKGWYQYAVSEPAGYQSVGKLPLTGYLVQSGSKAVSLKFAQSLYPVEFTEAGLTGHYRWSVTVTTGVTQKSVTERSTTGQLTFYLPNGTYTYTIGAVKGYTASGIPTSQFSVYAANVYVDVQFTS